MTIQSEFTFHVRSYRHAEHTLNEWWHTQPPMSRYDVFLRGTFFVHDRLSEDGEVVIFDEWREVLGFEFRQYEYILTGEPWPRARPLRAFEIRVVPHYKENV